METVLFVLRISQSLLLMALSIIVIKMSLRNIRDAKKHQEQNECTSKETKYNIGDDSRNADEKTEDGHG